MKRQKFGQWKYKTLMFEWRMNQSVMSMRSSFMNDSHNLKNVLNNIRQGVKGTTGRDSALQSATNKKQMII